MKARLLVLSLAVLAASCTAQQPPAAAPEDPTPAPKTFDPTAIDAWVGKRIKALGIPGASLAIARNGQIVLSRAYGTKSVKGGGPVTTDTAFAIGSVTKQFACASVLLLAEDKKLALDDKVAKYYPDTSRANDLTLHDALSHLAGYADYYPLDFLDERMLKATTPEQIVKDYATKPLDFEPRTAWSYSNTGFILAGRVVERVSGDTFGAFVGNRIFKPLEMKHSALSPKDLTDVATGHTSFALGETEVAPLEGDGWLQAAGGIWATAEDLVKWDLGLSSHKVLSKESFDTMTAARKLQTGAPITYACGIFSIMRNGEPVLQHGGAVSGFHAANGIVPRTGSAVALLTSAEHVDAEPIFATIMNLLLKADTFRRPMHVAGLAPSDAARDLFQQMQRGQIDRSKLAAPFSTYMSEERIKQAAPRLKAMGDVLSVEEEDVSERGGAQNAVLKLKLKTATVRAVLHRAPDGKVMQFLLYRL